jgi:hypothetical protein
MSGSIVEVENEIPEVFYRFTPYECIYGRPDDERDQNSFCTSSEKIPGRVVERELKIT